MKKIITFIIATMALIGSQSGFAFHQINKVARQAPKKAEEPKIRVLIAKDISAALLEAKGPYAVFREGTKDMLSSGSIGKRFVVQPIDCGLRWGEEYPDDYQIQVVPRDKNTTLYVDGIQYCGAMSIYYNKAGGICIVNELPIEEFVKATLSSELSVALSPEAMASYAIAERTNACAQIAAAKQANRLWDVSSTACKYYGMGVTKQKNGIDSAVDLTKHIVLTQGNAPQHITLSREAVEAQSQLGLDAKRILKTLYPGSDLSVTVVPPPVAEEVR